MKKVASSRHLISKITRKSKLPTSSRIVAKSYRTQREAAESRNTESYYSDDDGDDNMVDQQYDMFREMYVNGHDPRVISHTMISAGLDPAVVIPREVLAQRSRSKSHMSRRPGGTFLRGRKNKHGPVQSRRNDLGGSTSQSFETPNAMSTVQPGHGYGERNNSDNYRHNNSYASVDERNGSFNEMTLSSTVDLRPTSRYQAVPVENGHQNSMSLSRDMRPVSRYQPHAATNVHNQGEIASSNDQRPVSQYHGSSNEFTSSGDFRRTSRQHIQPSNQTNMGVYQPPEPAAPVRKWKRTNEFQAVPINQSIHQTGYAQDNASVYSTDAMSTMTSSRRNRGFIRRDKTRNVVENLPQFTSGRSLSQTGPPPEPRSYVPAPKSEIGSVTSKTKRTFIRRNNSRARKRQSSGGSTSMQPVPYRQPRMTENVVDRNPPSPRALRKPRKQRSSATLQSTQSYSSTNNTSSLPNENRRSDRPTRVAASVPVSTQRTNGGVPLRLYPYDSEVYKPFKVMQILGHQPNQIIEALESAGLDPCVLYKGVDVNRNPNQRVRIQAGQDKWELKYSKRYFMHYYQNKNTGETLWKDEVDKLAENLEGQNPVGNETLMPHHITDDDI